MSDLATKTLDLGCGRNPANPFKADEAYGVDIEDFGDPRIRTADLAIDRIPFEDDSFNFVTGFDFLEHIPRVLYIDRKRTQPFIDLMSEVWRVLKPDGVALFMTPAFPHPEAFQDPQHVNYVTERSVLYFCRPSPAAPQTWIEYGRLYGFKGTFELVEQGWRPEVPYHLVWELRAVK